MSSALRTPYLIPVLFGSWDRLFFAPVPLRQSAFRKPAQRVSLPQFRIASIFSGWSATTGQHCKCRNNIFCSEYETLIRNNPISEIADGRLQIRTCKSFCDLYDLIGQIPAELRSRYFRMYSERISLRSFAVGRSTKNNSSNRPRRKSSDGSIETSFAVATTNTCFLHSCIQNRNWPTILVETPPSPAPLVAPDRPFRFHRSIGYMAIRSPPWSAHP